MMGVEFRNLAASKGSNKDRSIVAHSLHQLLKIAWRKAAFEKERNDKKRRVALVKIKEWVSRVFNNTLFLFRSPRKG